MPKLNTESLKALRNVTVKYADQSKWVG